MIQSVFSVATAALSLYMWAIFIRIILTWFRGLNTARAEEYLARITDPYLNWFRRHVRLQPPVWTSPR